MITINGQKKDGYEGRKLMDVLADEGYDLRRIAVEINGEIVSKASFGEREICVEDAIEVVSFVGGG